MAIKSHPINFQVRKEEPDIKRKWVQIGEINYHKVVVIEEKTLTVPLMREELIIEKKFTDSESPDFYRTETIRIPLREERVEINKHTFDLEKVDIFKQQLEKTQSFDILLKKEEFFIKTTGNPNLYVKKLD